MLVGCVTEIRVGGVGEMGDEDYKFCGQREMSVGKARERGTGLGGLGGVSLTSPPFFYLFLFIYSVLVCGLWRS